MSLPIIFIIIPTFNGKNRIEGCLNRLIDIKSSLYKLKIVVVDGGSTDDSVAFIKAKYPSITILESNNELWWTGAIKKGSLYAYDNNATHVIWLNDDDHPDPYFVEALYLESKIHPDMILASGVVYQSNTNMVHVGNKVNLFSFSPPQPNYIQTQNFTNSKDTILFDVCGGHGVLIPSKYFAKHYNLIKDKLLPHYYGDYSFFLNASKHHIEKRIVPKAIVYSDDQKDSFKNGQNFMDLDKTFDYLFSRKSAGNLRDRPLLALTHYPFPMNFYWALIFLLRSFGSVLRAIYWNLKRVLLNV